MQQTAQSSAHRIEAPCAGRLVEDESARRAHDAECATLRAMVDQDNSVVEQLEQQLQAESERGDGLQAKADRIKSQVKEEEGKLKQMSEERAERQRQHDKAMAVQERTRTEMQEAEVRDLNGVSSMGCLLTPN